MDVQSLTSESDTNIPFQHAKKRYVNNAGQQGQKF